MLKGSTLESSENASERAPVDQAFGARKKKQTSWRRVASSAGFPSRDGIYFAPFECLIYNEAAERE